jgi:hypothetical protein
VGLENAILPVWVESRHCKVIGACPLYPLKADIAVTLRYVSFGAKADMEVFQQRKPQGRRGD